MEWKHRIPTNVVYPAEPLQILIAPSAPIEAHAESTVVTMCLGYGKDEVPRLQWKYMENILTNDTPSVVINEALSTENDWVFVESILTLCDIGLNNTGNYSCTVNNSFGNVESIFTLNVKPNCKNWYLLCVYSYVSCLHQEEGNVTVSLSYMTFL